MRVWISMWAQVFLGILLLATPSIAFAQSGAGSAYEDWFARGELGVAISGSDRGYWWGPGGPPGDPRITLSLNNPVGVTGTVGIGRDWSNGVRTDLSVDLLANLNVEAKFFSASDGSGPAGHVTDISGTVSALSLMANLFVEPLKAAGNDSALQPFVTAGLGVSAVSMGEWTRINAAAAQPTRSWYGDTRFNFAWTVGGGVSYALDDVFGRPGFLDLTYRYTDLGQASGGSSAVNPPPAGTPTEPFNLHLKTHAVTAGVRFPIGQ